MSTPLGIGGQDRLMVLAPHPDDESLAAGGLIRRALSRGAALRVVFATDGENNPWTQRVVEKRLRIGTADRARFGALRRAEAFAALARLGVEPRDAVFLGFPDQGITGLLTSGDQEALARLVSLIATWRPTLLIVPSIVDRHPDHSALGVLTRLAVARLDRTIGPSVLGYLVHVPKTMTGGPDSMTGGPESTIAGPGTLEIDLTAAERDRKRSAVLCHRTQITVHRRKFLSFAAEVETFRAGEAAGASAFPGPIRSVSVDSGTLRLELDGMARLGALDPRVLLLALDRGGNGFGALSMALKWRSGVAEIRRAGDGAVAGTARLLKSGRGGIVSVPLDACRPVERMFAKIRRRFGVYDDAGWSELSAACGLSARAAPARPADEPEPGPP